MLCANHMHAGRRPQGAVMERKYEHCMTFVFFVSLFFLSPASSDDYSALMALKKGFHSSNDTLRFWGTTTSVCSWEGIACSVDGRVASLDLTGINLSGTISPEISDLEKLTGISLAGNSFTGGFTLRGLRFLKFVNISNNQFTGELGLHFSTLPSVEVFDAYNNNFTGYLPVDVVALGGIRHLDLGGNYFYGSIPVGYGGMATLEYLSLAGNDLRGGIPREIGNLTKLRELYLGYYNVFDGGIPDEIGNLGRLRHVDLSSCGLDGRIPPSMGKMTEIDTMYLHRNTLSGPIPRELGRLTKMENFDVSVNSLTGEIPSEFVDLKQLTLFNLFMNSLHGSIPEFLADFPNLTTLGLWRNNFTGSIPAGLGLNGKIQNLDLSSNKLTGAIPPYLCSSSQLNILILKKNFLFGPIPDGLNDCKSLSRVRLGQNFLNGSIPSMFLYLPELTLLELQDNYLSGPLSENPEPIVSKLGQLDLSNNFLSGPLPESISNYSSIQILLLGGNNFSGSIPSSIGSLQTLLKLDLSGNMFSGVIPPEIANCDHLTYMDLSDNRFAGPIPGGITGINILNYLNMSFNHFNETIPFNLSFMRSLTVADFSFNEFSGEVPHSGQFAVFNASFFAGNPDLCGAVINRLCNESSAGKMRTGRGGEMKLVLAAVLLVCSLIFAVAAVVKARKITRSVPYSWRMTVFQKVGFKVGDVLECVKEGNVIGRGGAGVVYYGVASNGVEIAVKKLLGLGKSSNDHGFKAEIQTLGSIRHRNIVRLLAFLSNKETNLLVYEYMKNGSLGEALHGKNSSLLGWNLRYKIAIEAARGLRYLHHDCSPVILHRDVKSNNILLNSSFEAHVADFGLAKFLLDNGASQCMSAIAGSYGYIAPEYAYTLKVDEKSDVYSYGVVVLELLTGRKPVGEFGEGVDIVQWSKRATGNRKEEAMEIVDPRLKGVPKEEAMHLYLAGMLCVQENSVERPTMSEVVQMLEESPCSLTNDRLIYSGCDDVSF